MATIRCFFIGHRDAPEELFPALEREVEPCHWRRTLLPRSYSPHWSGASRNSGCANSWWGGASASTRWLRAQYATQSKRHPEVALTLLLAYHPADRPQRLPACFDGSVYPDELNGVPKRCAIVRANRWAVERCAHLIAYAWQPGSNSMRLVEYAQKCGSPLPIHVTLLPAPRHAPSGS